MRKCILEIYGAHHTAPAVCVELPSCWLYTPFTCPSLAVRSLLCTAYYYGGTLEITFTRTQVFVITRISHALTSHALTSLVELESDCNRCST